MNVCGRYLIFSVREKRDQVFDDSRVDHHLDLLVPAVSQVAQGPNSVNQDLETKKK